jgi:hypothetical protein
MMASSGSATLALIAQMVMIVFLSFFSGACRAVYSKSSQPNAKPIQAPLIGRRIGARHALFKTRRTIHP